jgi:N-dimethylarginine dimethylaminohydrolase
MNTNKFPDHTLVSKQWQELHDALSDVATIDLINPVRGLPDMVFTANGGLVLDHWDDFLPSVIVSSFRYKERMRETPHFAKWFSKEGYYVKQQSAFPFEGEGDCLYVDGNYWLGHGIRTSRDAYEYFLRAEGTMFPLMLVDPRFYHLDTCFFPLGEGRLMYNPDAFDPKAQRLIKDCFPHTLVVNEEEALQFCCNGIKIGNDVFMPKCQTVADELKARWGLNVQQFDMSEFILAGGACKCLTLTLERDSD